MGRDMSKVINKYEILKKKKLNRGDNKNDQRGNGMEDDSSEYGHGDTDEESVDNSEQSEQNTDNEMEDDSGEYGHGDTVEESVDNSEQSEDMNDNEINNRVPTSVFKSINTPTYPSRILEKDGNEVEFTYGAAYYESHTGSEL